MIFTTIVCLEITLFVIWLVNKITGIMRRHKILSSVIIFGILYFMVSAISNNIVNSNIQKSNYLGSAVHDDVSIPKSSINTSTAMKLVSMIIPDGNSHDTGEDGSRIVPYGDGSVKGNSIESSSAVELMPVIYPGDDCHETGADGHKITLSNNMSSVNPTYQQMVNFIQSDSTDEIPYNHSSFTSTDFAERFHNNAEAAGYRCAWVKVNLVNRDAGYACNAFHTNDCGLVFIDCTDYGNPDNDKTVDLKVGKEYCPEHIGDFHHIYYSMGTVKSYQIYW